MIMENKNQQPTEEIYIEGVGTVKVYGKMNMKKMVQRMLKSKAITE
jgi:hypothetical protein